MEAGNDAKVKEERNKFCMMKEGNRSSLKGSERVSDVNSIAVGASLASLHFFAIPYPTERLEYPYKIMTVLTKRFDSF